MKKIIVAVFLVTSVASFAQKRELTLNESVLQQNRAFRPESYMALAWIPGTDEYTYLSDNFQEIKKTSAKKGETSTVVTVQDLNKACGTEFSMLFGYSWKTTTLLHMNDGQHFVEYDVVSKKGRNLHSIGDNGANAVLHPASGHVAYTVANNLHVRTASGEKLMVTSNEDPNIVSGQSIARNEFGISGGIFWSPSGSHLAFYQKDESDVKSYPLVDITTMPATEMPIKYPMAGQGSEKPKVGIYDVLAKKTVYISPKNGVNNYLTNLSWTPDGKMVLIAEVNRDQDHMWLNAYDAVTGSFIRTLFEETDAKWIEPEHPAFFPSTENSNFVWISERDGYNNLYYYNIEGKLLKQLTTNKFVVKDILQSSKKGSEIIFTATGVSPLNTLVYAVDLTGKQRLLTMEEGTHNVFFNEAGTVFIDQYSSHSVPNRVELKAMNGKIMKTLLVAKNKLADVKIGTAEIGQIQGKDGTTLYTRLIKPSNFDPNKKYPVLVYVYGGPHAQMITNSWLDGANLWMYWMAEQGYLVFTLDNRGSGERGKAFEQQIHRQLGTVEMEDQLSGVEYLKSLPYVDGNRLAVHGWSFGGFMTTSLMLRQAGTFNVGVAGGSVTDWKYYEVMYGERYMDTPEQNAKGYEQSSLFTHASKLKGDLLLIHGTVDDVVVPQHNYALVKKFVELGIQMDFFPYPMHKHNVTGKDRVHLMEKVLTYVIEHNQ